MSATAEQVAVTGAFDDIRSHDLRFLQEAAKPGPLTVLLWPDARVQAATGQPPKFPLAERRYILESVRFVSRVLVADGPIAPSELPAGDGVRFTVWADEESAANEARAAWCRTHGVAYRVLTAAQLGGFPESPPAPASRGKKVLVTGCYDWFHSGHVRFFEEASQHGELYVVVGSDANIRLLKGAGHPLLSQDERRYMVSCIRFVAQALISTGRGWLDAEPEIERLQPHIYAVNEDGDKGGKREFCAERGIEYLVLRRKPFPGLPTRSSTELRESHCPK